MYVYTHIHICIHIYIYIYIYTYVCQARPLLAAAARGHERLLRRAGQQIMIYDNDNGNGMISMTYSGYNGMIVIIIIIMV